MSFPFKESVAQTLYELQTSLVAPSEHMWMPGGLQFYHSERGKELMHVNKDVAQIANDQLQLMRAKAASGEGESPYVDFQHDGTTRLGEPIEFFWLGPAGGVRMAVRWNALADKYVASKDLVSFSPTFLKGSRFTGIKLNVGALLGRGKTPAFSSMRPIAPILKFADLKRRRIRFIQLLNQWLGQSGYALAKDELAQLRCLDQASTKLEQERPDLHEAYALLQAIKEHLPAHGPKSVAIY